MNTEITFWIGQQAHPLVKITTSIAGVLVIIFLALMAAILYDLLIKKHE